MQGVENVSFEIGIVESDPSVAFSCTAVNTRVDKKLGWGWQKFLEKGAITSKIRGGRLVFFVNIGSCTVVPLPKPGSGPPLASATNRASAIVAH